MKATAAAAINNPYGTPLFLNRHRIRGLASWASDGWQATLLDPKMSSVTVYVFDGYRLHVFNLGYARQPNKTSKAAFDVVFAILLRIGLSLAVYVMVRVFFSAFPQSSLSCFCQPTTLQRTVDRGSEGVSLKSIQLWRDAYIRAGGNLRSAIRISVCAAHLLDKGLQWSGAAGKASAPGASSPALDVAPVAGTAAALATVPKKGAGGGILELRGSSAMAALGGPLYRVGSDIRSNTSAHLALASSKGGKRIPQVVITRWGTHTYLGSRLLELWSIIKTVSHCARITAISVVTYSRTLKFRQMHPVTELQLYKSDSAAQLPWAQLRVTVDTNLPALGVALISQRAVMTAISILNTTTQPSAPLVWPVMLWLVLTIRKLLASAIAAGACKGKPRLLVDGTCIDSLEPPLTSLARYLTGLQHAVFMRYPFSVIDGDISISGIALSSSLLPDAGGRSQSLCGGKVRFRDGPGMNNLFILAAMVHPHVSLIAQYYDGGHLLSCATQAAEELFSTMYPSTVTAGKAGAKVIRDPLGPVPAAVSAAGADVPTLLRAAVKALRDASTELVTTSGASRFDVDPYLWMHEAGLTAGHTILAASQLATYSIQGTAADPERSHSEAAGHWTDDRRGLSVKAGSDGTVVAQFQRREARSELSAPVLSDIACLPQILHELQTMLTQEVEVPVTGGVPESKSPDEVDDPDTEIQIVAVFPGLPSPPARKETAAEIQIKAVLGPLSEVLSGLSAVVSNVNFSDVELAESVDADAAGSALAAGTLVALPDGQLAIAEAMSDTEASSDDDVSIDAARGEVSYSDSEPDPDSGARSVLAAPVPLGRAGNRSLRKAQRSLRVLEAEQDAEVRARITQEDSEAAVQESRRPAEATVACGAAAASEAAVVGKKRTRGQDKAPRQRNGTASASAGSTRGAKGSRGVTVSRRHGGRLPDDSIDAEGAEEEEEEEEKE